MMIRDTIYFSTLDEFIKELKRRTRISAVRIDGYVREKANEIKVVCRHNFVVATAQDSLSNIDADGIWTMAHQTTLVYCRRQIARIDPTEIVEMIEGEVPGIEVLGGIYDHPHIGDPPVYEIA